MIADIVAGVIKLLAAVAQLFRDRQLIDAGKAQQEAKAAAATLEKERQANAVQNDIGVLPDAAIEQLRNRWTRP